MENWKFIIAVLGLGFSMYKYLDAKDRELSWKKTETLLELAKYFDTDDDIREAVKIIEGNSEIIVDDLYLPNGEPIKEKHKELHYQSCKKVTAEKNQHFYSDEGHVTMNLNQYVAAYHTKYRHWDRSFQKCRHLEVFRFLRDHF